jgi:hypothetical protein
MELDVISFVIRWPAFGDIWNRSIGQLVSAMKWQAASDQYEETDRKKAVLGQVLWPGKRPR